MLLVTDLDHHFPWFTPMVDGAYPDPQGLLTAWVFLFYREDLRTRVSVVVKSAQLVPPQESAACTHSHDRRP